MLRRTIRAQLLLLILLASLPLAGLAFYDAYRDFYRLQEAMINIQLSRVDDASGDVQDFIGSTKKILSVLALRPDIRSMDPAGCDPLLEIIQSLSTRYTNFGVVRADGMVICSVMPLPKPIFVDNLGMVTLQQAIQTRAFVIGPPHLGPVTKRWVVWLGEPVLNAKDEVAGIVIASINLIDFHEVFDNFYWSGQTEFTLLDEAGVVLTRTRAPDAWVGMNVSKWAEIAQRSTGERGWFRGSDLDGRPMLFTYTRLPNGWRAITALDYQTAIAPIWSEVLGEMAFRLALMALLMVVGWWLAAWVSRPIQDLAGVARAVAGGDVTRRAEPAGSLETADVADAFNQMLEGRLEAEAALQRHRDGLEALVAERTAHLERARDAAEAANRAKSVFLATMTHELRSPLNAVIGFSGLLLQRMAGPINDEQATYLGYIQDGARRLLALISDLLDISRIEAGVVEAQWEPVYVPDVISQAAAQARLKAEAKRLPLYVDIAPEVSDLLTDRGRLLQILLNLLDNAVKFTDKGEVRLQADIETGSPGYLRIRVSDSGIGIPGDQLERIFEPFVQVQHSGAQRYEGSGLGLSISRRLAELLGGTLAAQSEEDRGSIFTLRLPLQPRVTL